MNIFRKNMQLKQNGSAGFVESENDKPYSPTNKTITIENFVSKTGMPTAKIRLNEDAEEILMHSSYHPIQEASKKAEILDFGKNTMIVVFGIGMGYHLLEIKKRMSSNSRVVVIENSMDVYNNTIKNIDMTELFNDFRFSFLLGLSTAQIHGYFQSLLKDAGAFLLLSNIQFLSLNYYDRIYPGFVKEISVDILKNISSSWFSLGNCAVDTLIGLTQNFKNIDEAINNPGINDMIDIYKDKPAVIVSAGPSLDKNIHLLKEVEGKALILSCEASLKGLLKRNIVPDAVFSIERVGVYDYFYKNKDFEMPEEIVLIAPPLIEPEVFKEFKENKKIICYRAAEPINMWINRSLQKGEIFMGSSVAHVALGFALAVGADPIILIGQDLAFSETGDTHGEDIEKAVKELTIKSTTDKDIIYIEGNNGKPIKSTVLWKSFLAWFERITLSGTDCTFINATEGGARIKGTQVMTLREAIDKYINNQEIERLYDNVPDLESVDNIEALNKLIDSFDEKIEYFDKMFKVSEECLKGLKKITKKYRNRYNGMTQKESAEVCAQLLKGDELLRLMKGEELSMLFFQGLFCSTAYEVNNLGTAVSNENIWKNVLIQMDFVSIGNNTIHVVLETLKNIKEFLQEKLERYPESVDIDKYIKIKINMNF